MASETVMGGLGIPDEFATKSDEIVANRMKSNDKISDLLIDVANDVRQESFGDCDTNLSEYEKKLIFSGFNVGIKIVENSMNQKANEALSGLFGALFGKKED
jgi:hypothetical protein